MITIYSVFKRYPLHYLKECIEGINGQTYTNFNYVFVIYGEYNDISGINEILKFLKCEYTLYIITEVESFIEAIKYAVSKCSTKYILRADCEDFLLPNALEKMIELNEKLVIPNYISVDVNGLVLEENVDGSIDNISSNCLMNRHLFELVKFHDFQVCRDGFAIVEYLKKMNIPITYLKEPLFKYRKNPGSITNNTRNQFIRKHNEQLVNDMYRYKLDSDEIVIDKNEYFIITNKRKIKEVNKISEVLVDLNNEGTPYIRGVINENNICISR